MWDVCASRDDRCLCVRGARNSFLTVYEYFLTLVWTFCRLEELKSDSVESRQRTDRRDRRRRDTHRVSQPFFFFSFHFLPLSSSPSPSPRAKFFHEKKIATARLPLFCRAAHARTHAHISLHTILSPSRANSLFVRDDPLVVGGRPLGLSRAEKQLDALVHQN